MGSSGELWTIFVVFMEFLANHRPPRALYRSLMAGRFIDINKHPGFLPVGVGET